MFGESCIKKKEHAFGEDQDGKPVQRFLHVCMGMTDPGHDGPSMAKPFMDKPAVL